MSFFFFSVASLYSTHKSRLMLSTVGFVLLAIVPTASLGEDAAVDFTVQLDVVKQQLDPTFCWFHPRVASIPGKGKDGKPLVLLTILKHLAASDHYSGLYVMKTADLGATWTDPMLPKELDWRKEGDVSIAVADVTPGWHAKTGKILAIGVKVRYSAQGAHLTDQPRSYDCSYAVYDPTTDGWTAWRELDMPIGDDGRFHHISPGCCQWVINPDGTVLIPVCYQSASGGPYSVTVLQCAFDGATLKFQKHGDELHLRQAEGLLEPSLAYFAGRYYLTIRYDDRGYLSVSDDGEKFSPIKAWTFDDGADLGSFNTQQHWVTHSDGLFLAYTRRGANNKHIPRGRAPLFMARVDTDKLEVIRASEKPLIPERGAQLGNFGAAAIDENESWVTDSEFILASKADPRGANGSTFLARVKWNKPNRIEAATGFPR